MNRLFHYRKLRGLSRLQLAVKARMTTWAIEKIEKNITKDVKKTTMEKLGHALSIHPSHIFFSDYRDEA